MITIESRNQSKLPRFPQLQGEQMNDAQKRVFDEIKATRGSVGGPFGALLRSPDLMDRWQKLGWYLRFETSVPPRLNEFAILITAVFYSAKFEWYAHKPLAIKEGLSEAIVQDLAQGKRPKNMKMDEEVVYNFCTALHQQHFVDDSQFNSALKILGEKGLVELIAVTGFYVAVSMMLNVAEIPLPSGEKDPW